MKNKDLFSQVKPVVLVFAAILLALSIFFGVIAISSSAYDVEEKSFSTTEEGAGDLEQSYALSEEEDCKPSEEQTYEHLEKQAYEQIQESSYELSQEQNAGETLPAEDKTSENQDNVEVIFDSDNVFDYIYSIIEENADKIFSILAFVGTVIVGVGYKSGFLPLLRDALSKLKGSIDKVKEEGESNNLCTREKISNIGSAITEINDTLAKNTEEVARIKWQFESYEEMCREREKMRTIMQGQIDMLYAIFMSSALPQYQKEEIGTKISEMREELKAYEN